MSELEQLQQAITALEAQRAILGDSVVNAALAPMREKLTALQARTHPAEQQRKQVTVLFADISGFTAMSERLDAEDLGTLINTLWARFDGVILEHGGTIDKHIGDEVMALWGTQQAREDDPERAVRAALTLQAQLRVFCAESGLSLQMRIGINTGPVLLGAVGTTGEYSAIGDTVNVASRLQHAAPIGSVLISNDTYRHVRGLFDVQAQSPLVIRGKAEPVQTYVVERVRPPAARVQTRGVEGIQTRMVGRDAELGRLQDAFHMATQESKTHLVTIIGDPGIGKSRLLAEFVQWLQSLAEPVEYFRARATPQTAHTPYMLLRDLLAARCNILDNDPLTTVHQKLEDGLAEFLSQESQMKAHFIGALLGYDFADSPHLLVARNDPQQLFNRALYYLTQFIAASAEQHPSVILLEDIHWADHASLDLFSQVAQDIPAARLLLVCLARPTLFEHYPEWGTGLANHIRLTLTSLSQENSRELVSEILHKAAIVPDALRELIVAQAEGNPFYVEELIKVLIDDGVIVQDAASEMWHIEPARLNTLRVPATLTAVLQARLDSLPPVEKTTLQQAAVVGRIFWDAVLNVLQESIGNPHPGNATLDTLCQRELIYPHQPAAFAGVSEYLFKHALLRDVTYESVLKRARQAYHAQVAAWLVAETAASGRTEEYASLIADHYALAGEVHQAVDYLRHAAEHAMTVSAFGEAQALAERSLALLDKDPGSDRPKMALHKLLGDAHQRRGNFAPALEHYHESLALARILADAPTLAGVFLGMAEITLAQGDPASARQQYLDALAHTTERSQYRAVAMHGLGLVAEYEGDFTAATDYYQQSLSIHREIDNQPGIAQSLNDLGVVAYAQEDLVTATHYYQQSLTIKRAVGDRAGIAVGLNNLGDVAERQGDHQAALSYFLQSLEIDHDIGNRRGQIISWGNLIEVYLELAQPDAAARAIREGLRLAQETHATPLTLYILGQAALWRVYTHEPIQAAEWVGMVTNHPLVEPVDRDGFIQFRGKLEAAAPADEIASAWTRGQMAALDEVVEQVLHAVSQS